MSDAADGARPSRRLLAALGGGVLAIACIGYGWTGSPSALRRPAAEAAPVDDDVAATVERLGRRLATHPDDAAGWALLGRSYAVLGRGADASAAYAKALALRGDDPDLLADYADVLAAQQRSLAGEPTRLLERALAVAPQHPKALLFAGIAAFERGDYAAATAHWERIGDAALGDDALAQQLRRHLAEARRRGATVAASASASASTATAAAAARGTAVGGVVSLAPALAAIVAPDDTLFVFARAASGPRQPLAVLRRQVRDLPLSFTLDDGMAMTPRGRLSQFDRVVVGARISRSGDAMPHAGDPVGQTEPVAPGTTGLRIEIANTVPVRAAP